MSDNDNAKPENDTLKGKLILFLSNINSIKKQTAHDEWLLNSTNHSISDANQKILISLADSEFVDRLINLSKRPLDEADNVWNKLENLQVRLTSPNQRKTSISPGWRQLTWPKRRSICSERVYRKWSRRDNTKNRARRQTRRSTNSKSTMKKCTKSRRSSFSRCCSAAITRKSSRRKSGREILLLVWIRSVKFIGTFKYRNRPVVVQYIYLGNW